MKCTEAAILRRGNSLNSFHKRCAQPSNHSVHSNRTPIVGFCTARLNKGASGGVIVRGQGATACFAVSISPRPLLHVSLGTLGDVLMPCTPRSNPDARGRDCGRLARSAPISFNPRRAMGPPVFLICLDKDSEAAHFRGCAWKRYGGVTVVNRSI